MGNSSQHPIPNRVALEKESEVVCDECQIAVNVFYRGDVEIRRGKGTVVWHFYYILATANRESNLVDTRASQLDAMFNLLKHCPVVYMFQQEGDDKHICTNCFYIYNSKTFYRVTIPLAESAYVVNEDQSLLYNVKHPHDDFGFSSMEYRELQCHKCSSLVEKYMFDFVGKTQVEISKKDCKYFYRFADEELQGVYGFSTTGFDAIIPKSIPIIGMFELADKFYCTACLPKPILLDVLVSFSDKIALYIPETEVYHLHAHDFNSPEAVNLDDVTKYQESKMDREGPDFEVKGVTKSNSAYVNALLGPARLAKAISRYDTQPLLSKTATTKFASTKDSAVNIGASTSSGADTQASPRSAQASPRSAQASPRSAQASPRSAQANPRSAQANPRSAQANPKSAQASPRRPQANPRSPQASPRSSQDSPRSAQDSPRSAQDSPRSAQDRPRSAQDSPRSPQASPRHPQASPRSAQASSRSSQDSSRSAQASPRSAQASPRSAQASPRSAQASPRSAQASPRSAQASSRTARTSSSSS